jgi:hypothetical protein
MKKHLENLTKAVQCADLLAADIRDAHSGACVDQPTAADNLLEAALLPLPARPANLGSWREGEPPHDREIWIEGNLIIKDGCLVTAEPFRCRARWKEEVSFMREDGTRAPGWVGEDGLTLCLNYEDEMCVHRWADLEVRFELRWSPRLARRSGRPTIAALPVPRWHTDDYAGRRATAPDDSPEIFAMMKGASDRELLALRECQRRFLDNVRPWRGGGFFAWLPWDKQDELYRAAEIVEYWILREIEDRFAAGLERRECAAKRAALTRRWKKTQPERRAA